MNEETGSTFDSTDDGLNILTVGGIAVVCVLSVAHVVLLLLA